MTVVNRAAVTAENTEYFLSVYEVNIIVAGISRIYICAHYDITTVSENVI